MIHWSELGGDISKATQARWRRTVCKWELRPDGTCDGVACSPDDDEPHDFCKVCDALSGCDAE